MFRNISLSPVYSAPIPHGNLVAYKNFQFYCAIIVYHVGLNAESKEGNKATFFPLA